MQACPGVHNQQRVLACMGVPSRPACPRAIKPCASTHKLTCGQTAAPVPSPNEGSLAAWRPPLQSCPAAQQTQARQTRRSR
eukprot:363842-Chlamydomonas_euryale.AAC.3